MDVLAYDLITPTNPPVVLGSIATQIWVSGFKYTEDREIQPVKLFRASSLTIFDRRLASENFQFAAGRSFTGNQGGLNPVAQALQFMYQHPATVPHKATLKFTSQGETFFLQNCGIPKVELLVKKGALVVFGYTITGGTFSIAQNL
ncbi:MAG: hypothetical protein ABSG59_18255 [Verrucomicrobiota bacterium]